AESPLRVRHLLSASRAPPTGGIRFVVDSGEPDRAGHGTRASGARRPGTGTAKMGFEDLHEVVPWGRPFAEYVRMFALAPADLDRRVLDCGGGPASFAAEAAARGHHVVASDPLYRFTDEEIARRIHEVYPAMVAGMEAARDRFNWTEAGSPRQHAARRLAAMRRFLADFAAGRYAGRYVAGALPALGFRDDAFDLALSSHFLFLYSGQRSLAFHLEAIEEMLR